MHWSHFSNSQVHSDDKEPHLTVRFTPATERVWIVHVPPYTNRNLDALLAGFRASPYLKTESVGRTVEHRKMLLLTDFNSRLGRCPEVSDRQEFGAGLLRALAAVLM